MEIKTRAEALSADESKYFTGKPCRNGHLTYRYTTSGTCSGCISDSSARNAKPRTAEALGLSNSPEAKTRKRGMLAQLTEVKIRCYVDDLPAVQSTASMLLVGRYPELTADDAVINRPPTDGAGGTALYKLRLHPQDVDTVRQVAQAMMNARAPDLVALKATMHRAAQEVIDEATSVAPDFVP